MNTVSTLERLALHLGANGDEARMLSALQAATGQIERLTNRHFCPRYAIRSHSTKSATTITLDDDLLTLISITDADGNTINVSDVQPIPFQGAISSLEARHGVAFTSQVDITGTWGWHKDWSNAWRDSNDTLAASLNASDTTIIVGAADGADAENESPRFQVGQLIRIDAEYMRVVAITLDPGGTDDLTVLRGINGTTAVSHNLGAGIDTFQPDKDVESLVLRWAAWLYREPDMRGELPEDLLPQVRQWRREGVA